MCADEKNHLGDKNDNCQAFHEDATRRERKKAPCVDLENCGKRRETVVRTPRNNIEQ